MAVGVRRREGGSIPRLAVRLRFADGLPHRRAGLAHPDGAGKPDRLVEQRLIERCKVKVPGGIGRKVEQETEAVRRVKERGQF